eukprot:482527_1
MSLTTSNVVSTATASFKYNQWGARRIEARISEKIRIRFGNRGISLGITYYVKGVYTTSFEKKDAYHWTGPTWRQAFLLLPKLFSVWEPSLKDSPEGVTGMHFFINVQRFM